MQSSCSDRAFSTSPQDKGDLEAAYRVFSEDMFQNVHDWIKGTFVLVDMILGLGQLREAERVSEQGLKLAKAFDPPMPIGTEDIYSGMSGIHREKGDLEAAAQDLTVARKLGEQVDLPDWLHRWYIAQARLQESLGNLDHALELQDQTEYLFVQTPVPVVQTIAALKAQGWVRQGQLDKASNWIQERGLATDDDIGYLCEFEHLTLVRVLILQYQRDQVDVAIRIHPIGYQRIK